MSRTLLLALSACLLASYAKAGPGPEYRSRELRRLVAALQLTGDSLREGHNLFFRNNRQVGVSLADGSVQQVGYCLFSDEMKAAAHTPLLDFLERYFLQLDYPEADRPPVRKLREDRFLFHTGSMGTVHGLRSDDAFAYRYDQKRYVATWTRGGQELLCVSFPADRELISGENKEEAEQNVEADIRHAMPAMGADVRVSESALTATMQQDCYVRKGATYLNDKLRSDLYYQRQGGAFALLLSASHPLESAANMMLSPDSPADCSLRVRQVMYGYRKKDYDVPLRGWIAFCQNAGCELYYGVESMDDKVVKASVVAVNKHENYNHVLFVDIPLSVIESGRGTIDARMETFIPMHNVLNLFDQFKKTK